MKYLLSILLVVTFVVIFNYGDTQEDTCTPGSGITPICGFMAPEDLEVLPGGEFLLAGGLSLHDGGEGDLRVMKISDHSIQKIYDVSDSESAQVNSEGWGDSNCPGPPAGFSAHGMKLTQDETGRNILLVINHTSREAVEYFEITNNGDSFKAEWIGCVVVGEGLWINDLAVLPKSGFVASHMMPHEIWPTIFDRPHNDKVETGYIVEWNKDIGWKKVEGTEGALPNGVETSQDGTVIYNNHYQSNQVVAIERATGKRLWTSSVKGAPDNLSITPGGQLLLPTHLGTLRQIRDCMGANEDHCDIGFAVYSINPLDGSTTHLFESSGPPFGGATSAVKTGEHIYLGAFSGNRIGRISALE